MRPSWRATTAEHRAPVSPGVQAKRPPRDDGYAPEQVGALLGRQGRVIGEDDVEDIASIVGFLASEDASYITGVTLPVTGGR